VDVMEVMFLTRGARDREAEDGSACARVCCEKTVPYIAALKSERTPPSSRSVNTSFVELHLCLL